MVFRIKKNHQKSQSNNVGVGEDKISNLPDELIHHILKFLPIKCVMSTCILSKRWKYLSNSIPTLDFREWRSLRYTTKEEEHVKLETQQFMNFMDTVLHLHEKQNIQKFYLEWDKDYDYFDESRITKWIGILIRRKVEKLFLSGGSTTSLVFPLSFFTCDSLAVLKLDHVTLNVPNAVSFPRLKLLQLYMSEFSSEKLVSNCPILEELRLLCCSFKSEDLCIANLALKNLDISVCSFRESTVKICAPNLLSFSYGYQVPVDFVIDKFPSLIEANIDVYGEYPTKTIIKLLEKLSNVKLLKISGLSFKVLHEADFLSTNLSAFDNLTHLEVIPGLYFMSSGLDCVSVRIFLRILRLSPNLESIVFAKGGLGWSEVVEYDASWSVDPKCSLPHLKSITFQDFEAKPMEMDVIKLFLKYAGILETITIVASRSLSGNYEAQIKTMRELLMFPRPNCVVKFC